MISTGSSLIGRPADDTQTRMRSKEQTRQNLMQAALNLIGTGNSFPALGIREIAREAGVVPTTFYRHFKTTDDLGLALVQDSGVTLRRLLREARQASLPGKDMIRHSVNVFVCYLKQHHLEWRFISSERTGGSSTLRDAIRCEILHFTNEMINDLRLLKVFPSLSDQTLALVCGVTVTLMMNSATDFLDMRPDQSQIQKKMLDTFIQQIAMVFLGAAHWEDKALQPLFNDFSGKK
jgi:AcrR family transcriptional regulator